jgi:hypothetical protein
MIWRAINVLKAITEKDRLGNDCTTGRFDILAETKGRFSPWTDTDVEIEGRDVTENEQRYLLPVPYDTIKTATHADFGGKVVEITQITDNAPRWTVLQVRRWK